MIELPSSRSAATDIRCCPRPRRFSRTTTHSPLTSAVVLPSRILSSNTLIVAPGGPLPATTAAPSGLTRAISIPSPGSALGCAASAGESAVAKSTCRVRTSSPTVFGGLVAVLIDKSMDWVCGDTSAVSSSAKKTTPSASAASTPPTPKRM